MKRIVSMLLAVCMCLSVGIMLTACSDEEHTHTYKTEWSKDTTHHWHACEGDKADRGCDGITDKAEHTWNEGEITTESTAEADGVKTFTCTVCGHTKTEKVEIITTVSEEEWTESFNVRNYTCYEYQYENGEKTDSIEVLKATETLMFKSIEDVRYKDSSNLELRTYLWRRDIYKIKQSDGSWVISWNEYIDGELDEDGSQTYTEEEYDSSIEYQYGDDLPDYKDVHYDENEKAYVMEYGDESCNYTMKFYFGNKKLNKIVLIMDEKDSEDTVMVEIIFSDYGTTVVDTVTQTVTKDEWETAFDFECSFLQRKMNVYESSTHIVYAESNVTENKIKMIEEYPGEQIIAIDYMEKVDGGWYYYDDKTQSGDIDAVREYTKQFQTPEDCHGEDEFESTKNTPKNDVSQFAEFYEAFRYDGESKSYIASEIDSTYSNISIIFRESKIYKITYTDGRYTYEIEFVYDEFEIVLPKATEVSQ